MPTECKFLFARSQPVFFTGEIVHGQISITTTKAKTVSAIILHINGHAKTRWSEDDHNHVGGPEHYIKKQKYLLGSETSEEITLPQGSTTYSFSFKIPPNCPSSFESQCGHVRYKFKLVLMRSWKFNQNFTKGFTVMKMVNLNNEGPLVRSAMRATVENVFTFCFCNSMPLKVHVDLPQGGYVPGQSIPVSVFVSNASRVDIRTIKVKLIMLAIYRDDRKYKKEVGTTLSKYASVMIQKYTEKLLKCSLNIPPTPPTCTNASKYIDVSYVVRVQAIAVGMNKNPEMINLPIVIGNVPLLPYKTTFQRQSRETIANEAKENVCAESPPPPWEEDHSIPPPTYEESMHMPRCQINADELNDYGEREFSPRYATFKVPSPAAAADDEIIARFGSFRTKSKRK